MLYNQTMARKKRATAKKKESFGVVNQPEGVSSSEKLDLVAIEKEFVEILNYQRKQENNLLGSFVEEKYAIPDNIVKELISIPKKFDHFEDNIMYCATVLGEFVLNFKIEMDISPDYCSAKLYIIETEMDVAENIKHVSLLSEIVDMYKFEFRKEVEESWNVYYDDDVLTKTDATTAIYNYLHMQSEDFLFNRELVEILSQLYLVRMLALLDKMGDVGDKVRLEYKLLMEKFLATDPSVAQNYTFQRRILNHVLKSQKAFETVLKTEEGAKILKGYSTPLKNVRDKTYPTVLTETKAKTPAKTPEKTKDAKSKPSIKKKSAPAKKASGKAIDPWQKYKATVYGGSALSKPKPAPARQQATSPQRAQPTPTGQSQQPNSQPQREQVNVDKRENDDRREVFVNLDDIFSGENVVNEGEKVDNAKDNTLGDYSLGSGDVSGENEKINEEEKERNSAEKSF